MPALLKPLLAGLAFLLASPAPVQTGPVSQAEFQAMLARVRGGASLILENAGSISASPISSRSSR